MKDRERIIALAGRAEQRAMDAVEEVFEFQKYTNVERASEAANFFTIAQGLRARAATMKDKNDGE